MDRNCFNIFRFLAEVSTNLQKNALFWAPLFRGGKKEIREMTLFFHLLFELSL